uniref:Uncharacterized protein n=1 Tax=Trichogramma kaykai TaxID=54128 RepID=A0ABD2WUX8_9HYME
MNINRIICLKQLSPSSKDIYKSHIFDKYEKRKNNLEDMCLSDFACKFSDLNKLISKDDETLDNNENPICRQKEKIIRYYNYKLDTDPMNYYKEHLLLFLPFRNENTDINNKNYKQLFTNNIDIIKKNKTKYFKINEIEIEKALDD